MITQMKKYTFLVFHRDYDTFLTQLRDLGVVHITEKAAGMADDEQLQALLQKADHIKKTLAQGAPDQLLQEKANIEQRIAATKKEAERMAVWGNFSAERIAELRQAGYALHYYACPTKQFEQEWGISVAEQESRTYFVQVSHVGEILPELPDCCHEQTLNEKSAADLQKDIDGLNGLLVAQNARIELWAKENIPALEKELKETRQQIDWKRVTLNTDTLAEAV